MASRLRRNHRKRSPLPPASLSLIQNTWIRQGHNLLITGATGTGKTWLGCALGHQACRQGLSVRYLRLPRLFEELRIRHGDGSFGRYLTTLAKVDLLILDDWGLAPMNAEDVRDLLEIIDDRVNQRAGQLNDAIMNLSPAVEAMNHSELSAFAAALAAGKITNISAYQHTMADISTAEAEAKPMADATPPEQKKPTRRKRKKT